MGLKSRMGIYYLGKEEILRHLMDTGNPGGHLLFEKCNDPSPYLCPVYEDTKPSETFFPDAKDKETIKIEIIHL